MISGINHITFAVADLQTSFDFYTGLLGCRPIARWPTGAYLSAGGFWLALVQQQTYAPKVHEGYSHIAFSVSTTDFPNLVQKLKCSGYGAWQANRSEGQSYYFKDPDGHKLEIHVGDLDTRLRAMKAAPWDEIEYF